MAKIYKNIEELIGKTPLLELTHLEEIHNLDARVLAKVEFLNPGGPKTVWQRKWWKMRKQKVF